MFHVPVLLNEVLEGLNPQKGDFIIDGTLDGGGHAKEIIARIGDEGMFLGVDLDPKMIEARKKEWGEQKNILLTHGNYANLPEILASNNVSKVIGHGARADGLLLDLGFSSEQLVNSGRGFSFKIDEPLLMTYSDETKPLYELLAEMDEDELERVIRDYGGERMARRVARAIYIRERSAKITRSEELADIVRGALPKGYERGRIDPATRTFQALRIYVNHELENLERVIKKLPEILKTGGRVAIITFHSLEDRIVKTTFKTLAKEGILELINKKPITASREEIIKNPRSRSAKLRIVKVALSC